MNSRVMGVREKRSALQRRFKSPMLIFAFVAFILMVVIYKQSSSEDIKDSIQNRHDKKKSLNPSGRSDFSANRARGEQQGKPASSKYIGKNANAVDQRSAALSKGIQDKPMDRIQEVVDKKDKLDEKSKPTKRIHLKDEVRMTTQGDSRMSISEVSVNDDKVQNKSRSINENLSPRITPKPVDLNRKSDGQKQNNENYGKEERDMTYKNKNVLNQDGYQKSQMKSENEKVLNSERHQLNDKTSGTLNVQNYENPKVQNYDRQQKGNAYGNQNGERYDRDQQKDMTSRNQNGQSYDRDQQKDMTSRNQNGQSYDRDQQKDMTSRNQNGQSYDRDQQNDMTSRNQNGQRYDRDQQKDMTSRNQNGQSYDRDQQKDMTSRNQNIPKYNTDQQKDLAYENKRNQKYGGNEKDNLNVPNYKDNLNVQNYNSNQQRYMTSGNQNVQNYERGQKEITSGNQNFQNFNSGQQKDLKIDNKNVPNYQEQRNAAIPDDTGIHNTKWMVITTIQEPTETVRQLAKIPGWKMVVIGDKKTPIGWNVPGVVYLDVAAQLKLGYSLTKHLAFGSYARKIIGYLYAIQHGAEFIYETDDDNVPLTGLKTFHLLNQTEMLMINTQNLTYNHYIHFGHPSLWPRGLPLDYFRDSNTHHEYKLCNVQVPAVQQGLVDGDPDFDSVVRLTRTNPDTLTHFDEKAPPVVLPMGTFSPTNSQNTVFRYQAFWSMIIPVTTSFRFCDIFRGYWAQRMLWLTGDRIGYYPTNAVQRRNKHSLINDALQETDFLRIGVMLKAMLAWTCTEKNIHLCAIELSKKMVDMGFLKQQDIDLFDAWFTDLKNLGYVLPEMKGEDHSVCGASQNPISVHFYPIPQNVSLPHIKQSFLPVDSTNEKEMVKFINNRCNLSLHADDLSRCPLRPLTEDKLLIIHIKGNGATIPVLETWYRRTFKYIVYCGNEAQIHVDIINKWKISYIGIKEPSSQVACLHAAINMGYIIKGGYLIVPETVLLNSKQLLSHQSQNNFWISKNWLVTDQETMTACQQGQIKCNIITRNKLDTFKDYFAQSMISKCFQKHLSNPMLQNGKEAYYLQDVVYYVPNQYSTIIQQMGAVQADAAQYDVRLSLLAECFEARPLSLTYSSLLASTQTTDYIYPYNANDVLSANNNYRSHFCEKGV